MKFSKTGHALLAAAVSLGVGLGITSCGQSNTIDYLYVTASKNTPGQISVYRVDQESGALTQIQDSPYSSGGRNPVAEVTSPNGADLYVVNQLDSTIVEFAIGTDGKLYPQHTTTTPGAFPQAIAINAAGTFLYVAVTFQPNFSILNVGPGALVAYPINSDGSLGTAVANGTLSYFPVQTNPLSVNVTANGNFVYVVNQNTTPQVATGANANGTGAATSGTGGTVSAFAVGSGGVLTAIPGSPFTSGVSPNASASDPTSRFYYVTDSATNQLIAYNIAANGALIPLEGGPFATSVFPDAVTIDPSGTYIYVANFNSNSISAYTITQSTGAPSGLAGATTISTDTGPTCVLVDPAFGRFVYTSNFLGNSISGFQLNTNTGVLTGAENSPFPTAGQPTCAAAVTHGNHPGEHVQATAGTGSGG
ncbi:6-phosphogluconolactonase (cycloisomerase 2 family) [Silvibacterium bohemicum]|uniref:6-phosphogluconolactonase (Cycloisomerase 2 family) n=1 Tax=Silvibacterium bohemicum TaxID=1577686 RepID=A0A841JN00_9BACT|nr:beta-propeller fold lactonase family protein [Silvibacterium bohemicum]MBB6142752.1 6-phosphogluconolactonase (cycloisomerase 2 family) [Silvibacterium bohemicum]